MMRYRPARSVPGRNRPSDEEVVEELRSFEEGELELDDGELVATVWVAIASGCTAVPQERQKRLFSGRSLAHLRHRVVCIRLMYHPQGL